ncbi:MAG: type II toxin-antitoxin system VapC family toxin [Patescibacteria group bacterium]
MIVVDASVVVKWIKQDEEDVNIALSLYSSHLKKKEIIVVPRLLFYEVANFLATKPHATPTTIKVNLEFLFNTNLNIQIEDDKELREAVLLAQKYHTSVYDMLYAVIAKNKKCILITADENFIKKTKFKHVKLLRELVKKVS